MHIDKYERYWIIAVSVTLGLFMSALIVGAVVFGVRSPDSGGFINPQELNESQFADWGVRDMGDNHYEVIMIAQMWAFLPREVRVPEGATVDFVITSRDVTHGFIIEHHNVNFELVPGHIARARVTFNEAGVYHYICHEYCGRLHEEMWGQIIVEEAVEEVAIGNEE